MSLDYSSRRILGRDEDHRARRRQKVQRTSLCEPSYRDYIVHINNGNKMETAIHHLGLRVSAGVRGTYVVSSLIMEINGVTRGL